MIHDKNKSIWHDLIQFNGLTMVLRVEVSRSWVPISSGFQLCKLRLICPRLPTHLEPEADINLYANASGFTSAIMKDLQRIFSCLAVDSGSDENRAYLSKVANGKVAFSFEVTLAMSSQSAWRRGWGCESWIGRSVIKLGFTPASVDLAAFFGHSRAASTLGPTVCRLVIHCLWP